VSPGEEAGGGGASPSASAAPSGPGPGGRALLLVDGFLAALADAGIVGSGDGDAGGGRSGGSSSGLVDAPAALFCFLRALMGPPAAAAVAAQVTTLGDAAPCSAGVRAGLTPRQLEEALGLLVQLVSGARAAAGAAAASADMTAVAAEVTRALLGAPLQPADSSDAL
jgi:hypothetical protein